MTDDYDPFDYPDDPPPPPPPRKPVDHDDDESTFWRKVREEAGRDRPSHRGNYADYVADVRKIAFTVPCRDCKAAVKEPCTGVNGEPLRKFPCHTHREIDARKALR